MGESVRVQMSLQTKKELENLAKNYNCIYNGNPSFSKLLEKIGNKELTIQRTDLEEKSKNLPLLLLKMTSPFDVNGIVAQVTRRIAKYKGNIFKIEAKAKEKNLGTLKIYLSLDDGSKNTIDTPEKLSKIINEIYKIKFEEIKEINEEHQLYVAYNILVAQKKITEQTGTVEQTINYLCQQNIIINISCYFGIKIKAKNKAGTLSYITKEIAQRKILISSVESKYNQEKKEDIISLFLEVKIQKDYDILSEITKIKEMVDFFKSEVGKNGIKEIQSLGIEYFSTL